VALVLLLVAACDGGRVGAPVGGTLGTVGPGTTGTTATGIPSVTASDSEGAAMKGQLGQSATVTVTTSNYAFFDGTSMATPHVAGVVARFLQSNQTASPATARASRVLPVPGWP